MQALNTTSTLPKACTYPGAGADIPGDASIGVYRSGLAASTGALPGKPDTCQRSRAARKGFACLSVYRSSG